MTQWDSDGSWIPCQNRHKCQNEASLMPTRVDRGLLGVMCLHAYNMAASVFAFVRLRRRWKPIVSSFALNQQLDEATGKGIRRTVAVGLLTDGRNNVDTHQQLSSRRYAASLYTPLSDCALLLPQQPQLLLLSQVYTSSGVGALASVETLAVTRDTQVTWL